MAEQSTESAAGNPAETYESLFVPAMFLPFAEEFLERVAPQPGERVLDVACGTGAVTRQLPPLVGGDGSIVGVDASPGMLAVARSIPLPAEAEITWTECSAEALPLPDASFDVVLCQHGLQFFSDRQTAVNEMHRVLVPGGRVGIVVWRSVDHQPLIKAFDDAMERHTGQKEPDVPFSMGDPDELRELLVAAGFHDITIESATRTVRFPFAEQFVAMTLQGAAAVIPEYAAMSEAERDTLVEAVRQDLDGVLLAYRDDDSLAAPMTAHIAVAMRAIPTA